MSDTQVVHDSTVETPATTEVTESTAATVVAQPEEIVYEYQPADDLGRPLGAKQVFKGTSLQEIADKIADSNKNLIKLNRDLNKRYRLGELSKDEIPEGSQRVDRSAVEFNPIELTDDDKVQLARDLSDPSKFDEVTDRLFEAKIGASPTRIREVLQHAQEDISAMRAKEEAKLFVQSNPDYYVCPDNFKTIANWMMKNSLAPTCDNFQLAFDRLKAVGLLLEAPIVREEKVIAAAPAAAVATPANTQPGQENASRITDASTMSQTKRTPQIASGLTSDNSSAVGTSSKSTKLTVAEIEAMPSDVYKRKLNTDPAFRKAAEEALTGK